MPHYIAATYIAGPPHVGGAAACWPAYMRGYVPQTLWLTETALRRRDRERQTERETERERDRECNRACLLGSSPERFTLRERRGQIDRESLI